VFSFSFTSKELRNDPWAKLREDLEQLDIKYSAEYEHSLTSHVISKKRNTSKGLQALINGKYIVADSFVNAVIDAATSSDADEPGATSALEQDYDGNWPNALEHLPPRGEEPSDRPEEAYAPDERRQEVFDGYTFVFYEKKQYENLFSAIANGKGKALFMEVVPGQTEIDDFIRYVKGVAGEKGLGSFEDGSEGKGVVVVRYLPAKGADFEWFAEFLTSVALRLDHRPIDQREFLDAILAGDASMLRRPLEEESQSQSMLARPRRTTTENSTPMDVAQPEPQTVPEPAPEEAAPAPRPRRGRTRRGVESRFKGFDLDVDVADTIMTEPTASAPSQDLASASTSLPKEAQPEEQPRTTRRTQRKRAHSPTPEGDSEMMDGIAPTAAAVKRRRVEAGEEPVPASAPEPEPADDVIPESPAGKSSKSQAGKLKKKGKENVDILELARQNREEAEARAAAERDALNSIPDDGIDYAAIRALQIVEECSVHFPDRATAARSRERDVQDGRWDPNWNGRQNFKKFRKQGEPLGRPAARVIVGLEEVRAKEYGIGDDYWLEDEDAGKKKKKDSQRESQSQPATQSQTQRGTSRAKGKQKENTAPPTRRVVAIDSSDEGGPDEEGPSAEQSIPAASPEPELSRTRTAKAAEKANARLGQTQSQQQPQEATQSQATTRAGKRVAAAPPAGSKAAKKPRKVVEIHDSDDSDDAPRFRFGRR
jgi:DNA repair protein XRS2